MRKNIAHPQTVKTAKTKCSTFQLSPNPKIKRRRKLCVDESKKPELTTIKVIFVEKWQKVIWLFTLYVLTHTQTAGLVCMHKDWTALALQTLWLLLSPPPTTFFLVDSFFAEINHECRYPSVWFFLSPTFASVFALLLVPFQQKEP